MRLSGAAGKRWAAATPSGAVRIDIDEMATAAGTLM
jgi:hypothetical protein